MINEISHQEASDALASYVASKINQSKNEYARARQRSDSVGKSISSSTPLRTSTPREPDNSLRVEIYFS